MSGGTVAGLQQGDGYDTFLMTGGTITGAFVDGDYAEQSGGTIGRVDMKLADNFYYLSGGQILGNLVTGFGLDTIVVSGGAIGGNVSTSGGNDVIRVSGGSIEGEIRASFGNDTFDWTGGAIFDNVLMGADSDVATLGNLSANTIAAAGNIDGGRRRRSWRACGQRHSQIREQLCHQWRPVHQLGDHPAQQWLAPQPERQSCARRCYQPDRPAGHRF
ncbi:hypothetical protein N8D56_16310 [Devosia sp. A8/3-2]|nr:hypothetical protein N8D56_16310 [Devosia sp. A8/3-2]